MEKYKKVVIPCAKMVGVTKDGIVIRTHVVEPKDFLKSKKKRSK